MDWDIALKVAGVFFTVIGGLYHWRNIRFRSNLKADLEILKLYEAYGTDNPNFGALKNHVDKTIAKAYPSPVSNETTKIDRDGLIIASVNLVFSALFIATFFVEGVYWGAVILAVFTGSVGILVMWAVLKKRFSN